MPRRKRITGLNERRRKVPRRDNNNDEEEDDEEEDTLVISDSDSDEEEEDCAMNCLRTTRRLDRQKKADVQDMTEDEMLALALRLSKQEANCASEREQVEDDEMRKAIEESLQVSCSQASGTSFRRTRSVAKPPRGQDSAPAPVRCKLSFPGKIEKDAEDVSEAQTSAVKCCDDGGALPPMPDLSQRTLSQPSPPSPTLPSVPSAASQESRSSRLAKQEVTDEAFQSDRPLERSSVLLRHCTVRINQNRLNASKHSRIISPTAHRSLSFSSPEKSQNSPPPPSPPPPKSPVFPKTDSKKCTKSTRGKFSDCTSSSRFRDGVRKLDDTCKDSSSHKSSPGDRAPKSDVSSSADATSLGDFTSHMVLHLSDDDDDDDESDDKIIPPSPVFPQDQASCAGQPKLLPTQPCPSSPTAAATANDLKHTESLSQVRSERQNLSRTSGGSRLAPTAEGEDVGAVSYYWGVPFCPKGQSPDDYTRVILGQLEVYEKSLKEAQRCLLHKADWGLPVFPCPVEKPHARRLKRHRVPLLLEEDEEEDEEQNGEEKKKKKRAEPTEREESRPRSAEGAENGQRETYVVVSSPETQEELGQKSPLRFKQESTNAAKRSSRRKPLSQELSENTQIHSEPDEHVEEGQSGCFDAESAVCPETQMTEDHTQELMVTSPAQPPLQADADVVMEVDEASVLAAEAEEGMEQERPGEEQPWRESASSQVECPMCTHLFPLGEIEMHAAYCNGSVEDQEEQENLSQGSARRRSVRRTAVEDCVRLEKSEQQEKCYVCNRFFTSKEYSHHVDQCLQQKHTSAPKQGNGLLSALNRTETMHLGDGEAGPSNPTVRLDRNHTDSSVGKSVESLGYHVSSSPIKSFTPISEITDCLIDFRQQYPDRSGQRLGRKRKFKR